MPPSPGTLRSPLVQRFPVYYGWMILLVGSLGMFMTVPGQTVGVSVFLDSIIADLGITRTTVSLMYTFATLAGSLALPFVGRYIDAKGPRLAVVGIAALFALACTFMGLAAGPVMLFLGFVLIRGLGQGSLSMVSVHVINLWFIRRRGLALGLSGLGFMLSFAVFPPLIDALIEVFSWRGAYIALGVMVAVTILPLGAIFFRTRPERFGLLPDGIRVGNGPSSALLERNLTLAQARRTGTFWLYLLAGLCMSMLGTALLFHNYDILGQNGIGRSAATAAFGTLGLVAAVANLVSGALLDRLSYRLLLAVQMAMLIAVMLLAGSVSDVRGVVLYGTLFGLMQGTWVPISASVYAKHFGRRHLGSIKGFVATVGVAASALGPFLFSVGFDLFGSYLPVLMITALLPLALMIATPFVRPPEAPAVEPAT